MAEPLKTHPENATQTLGTHQENYCCGYDFASECAVAPNSAAPGSFGNPINGWVYGGRYSIGGDAFGDGPGWGVNLNTGAVQLYGESIHQTDPLADAINLWSLATGVRGLASLGYRTAAGFMEGLLGAAESGPSTIGEMLPGVHPDSMIHLTPAGPGSFAGGVEGGTFWARLGDVSHMTLEEYQLGVVGPGAPASFGNSVSGFVVSAPRTGSFMWEGAFNGANVMEHTNSGLLQGTSYFLLP